MDIIEYLPHLRQNRLTMFVYYGMRALVVVFAAIFLIEGDWKSSIGSILVFLLMLIPSLLKKRWRMCLPFTLDFGILLFLFTTLMLGSLLRFYEEVPYWDKFLHFQSGLVLGIAGFVLVYLLNEHKDAPLSLSPGFLALFAMTFAITIGVLWEIVEYGADIIFPTLYAQGPTPLNTDTMNDLIADTVGALIVAVSGYIWMYRHKRLPFTPWVMRLLSKRKSIDGQSRL